MCSIWQQICNILSALDTSRVADLQHIERPGHIRGRRMVHLGDKWGTSGSHGEDSGRTLATLGRQMAQIGRQRAPFETECRNEHRAAQRAHFPDPDVHTAGVLEGFFSKIDVSRTRNVHPPGRSRRTCRSRFGRGKGHTTGTLRGASGKIPHKMHI